MKTNPKDATHTLFNYAEFFGEHPSLAIKDPAKFPGVVVYNRDDLRLEELYKLKLKPIDKTMLKIRLAETRVDFKINNAYFRQSYSGLTKTDDFDKSYDYYEKTSDIVVPTQTIVIRF